MSSIIRVKKNANYFSASNIPFNDKRLSWEARGVMGYLLSKPDDWTVRFNDLVGNGPAGQKKIRRILKELEKAKYLERNLIKSTGGKFDWESVIHETPTILPKGIDGEPTILPLSIDAQRSDLINTELTSTDKKVTKRKNNNKNKNKEEEEEEWAPTPFSQLSAAFVNKTKIPEFTGGAQKWNEAIQRMVKAGVEQSDIVTAIDELSNKNYTIIGIASVENAAISAMSKRLTRGGKHAVKDPQSYITGEFAEYIEH